MTDPMVDAWHIADGTGPRPSAERIIYADGAAGSAFRHGVDLELSHWVPTSTPERWAADTSTEACLRFVADPPDDRYGLAVNNHLDTDGVLALFVLVHPEAALAHRTTIIGAAEVGDFNAGADRASSELAQELATLIGRARSDDRAASAAYATAFDRVVAILEGSAVPDAAVPAGWNQLEQGAARLADGTVGVEQVSERLVSYELPTLSDADLATALRIPPHNAVIDDSVWLWPQVRNRDHGQRVQLTSVPVGNGWCHDLWLPGYVWAHTPERWRPPGLRSTGDSNVWIVDHPSLDQAVATLQRSERGPGTWARATHLTPFNTLSGRGFPVVVSCVDRRGHAAPSTQTPGAVADLIAPALGQTS